MHNSRKSHPNRSPFHGVLTLVDTPSDRPPAGSRGRRVTLTRTAAEAAIPSLIGMALGWSPLSDGHDVRRKVGIITHAEIAGRELRISGHIYAQDFPDAVRELQRLGPQRMGLSYELADAHIEDPRAHTWRITEATFTGAAILLRKKAAYTNTWIALGKASPTSFNEISNRNGANPMTKQQSQELIAATQKLAAFAETLNNAAESLNTLNTNAVAALAANADRIGRLEAAAEQHATRLETTVARIVAAVEEVPEEEEETNDSGSGEAPETHGEEETSIAAAATQITELSTLRQRITHLETENTSLRTQLAAHADPHSPFTIQNSQLRKTLPALVNSLLAKSNIEVHDGMDTHALDSALSPLSMEQRIAVKMQMARAGLIA